MMVEIGYIGWSSSKLNSRVIDQKLVESPRGYWKETELFRCSFALKQMPDALDVHLFVFRRVLSIIKHIQLEVGTDLHHLP